MPATTMMTAASRSSREWAAGGAGRPRDVGDFDHAVLEHARGIGGFTCHRQVGGAGTGTSTLPRRDLERLLHQGKGAGQRIVLATRVIPAQELPLVLGHPGGQDVIAPGRMRATIESICSAVFPSRDRFGHPLAQGAMVVDQCYAGILEGQIAQALHPLGDGQLAAADGAQQGFKVFKVHRSPFSVSR